LAAYALLSLHAMLYSAIALAISAFANKPVAALVYTYISVGLYSLVAYTLSDAGGITRGRFMSGTPDEMPFYVTLSPLNVVLAAGTHTTMLGVAVPNWILFGLYALFITRLLLLGAGSALSHFNSRETKNLRITGLATFGLLGYAWTYLYMATIRPFGTGSPYGPPSTASDLVCSNIMAVFPLIMLVPLPFITCSGADGERKYWPNGWFSFKEAIRGTPAGGLPYMLLVVLVTALGVWFADVTLAHGEVGIIYLSTIVWSAGFWAFCWSLGRWASAIGSELRSARTLHLASLIVLLGLPIPFLAIVDPEQQTPLWAAYPLYPLWAQVDNRAVWRFAMGLALFAVGGLIAYLAAKKVRNKLVVPSVMA
jgi:hypothetical protein